MGGPVANLLLVIAGIFFFLGRRLMKARASELRLADKRAPILILRAFKDDKIKAPGRIWALPSFWVLRHFNLVQFSLEELVAYETGLIGPPIIVGEPGERIPQLGAAREYFADNDWRTEVSKLIDEAAFLIFVLADTENLFWEFRTAIERHGKDRVLLIIPPARERLELRSRWQRFVESNAELLGSGVPRCLPHEPVIAFFFCQNEPVFITSKRHSAWHYILAIRLFIYLSRKNLLFLDDMIGFLQTYMPWVRRGEM
jgi:hypothetical protein